MRWENKKGTVELSFVSQSQKDSASTSDLIQRGMAHQNAGRLQQAEAIYKSILQEQPHHPDALHLLGHIAHLVGKHEIAVSFIEQALAIKPDFAEAYNNLGNALQELGRPEEAIARYEQALAIHPDYAEAYYNFGNALQKLGRPEEAITRYKQALAIKPDFAEVHNNLGSALQELGRPEEAIARYEQALAIKPDFAEAYYNFGNVLQKLGRPEDAIARYEQALAIRLDFAEVHNNIGYALQKLGRPEDAITRYEQALAIKPDYAGAHNNLGIALQKIGRMEEAFTCQRHAVALKPQSDLYWAYFAASLEPLSFASVDDNLWLDLWDLLGHSTISPISTARAVISALRHHPEFAEILKRMNTGEWDNFSYWDAADQLSSIPLLLRIMELSSIQDLEVEKMLTRLRRSMILNLKSGESTDDEKSLPFSTALALHCFTNEYVFQETTEETAAVELLIEEIAILAKGREKVQSALLAALAAYRPLYGFSWTKELLKQDWPNVLKKVIAQQIKEPNEEISLRNQIPSLTLIRDEVSQAVRGQYEENPYPRWVNAGLAPKARTIREVLEVPELGDYDSPKNPQILVAGCGTGQHALTVASRFSNATVLAIDLSLNSLSYAMRKTREYGFTNIEYAQADIMELGDLSRQFDLIECGGVLHHLEDPLSGWRVLLKLLRPDGLMKIGLYSELARRSVVQGRALIAEKGYTISPEDIRRCRQDIVTLAENSDPNMMHLIDFRDFFSLSECRDLLFHVKEHRFTLPQIETTLRNFDLKFLGFELKDHRAVTLFKTTYPEKTAPFSLSLWHKFETQNQNTFRGMYQFWVQKK